MNSSEQDLAFPHTNHQPGLVHAWIVVCFSNKRPADGGPPLYFWKSRIDNLRFGDATYTAGSAVYEVYGLWGT